MANNITFKAGGNILPARFLKISDAYTVVQADDTAGTNVHAIGVSAESTKDYPGGGGSTNHAESGDPVQYYGPGEVCLVTAGAAITAPALLNSDANGKAVSEAVSGQVAFARALEDASGDGVKVRVLIIDPITLP